jgi:hypothetical protein
VVQVQSSLTATGREHACPDEPLIFTCEVNSQFIQWTFNTFYRITFFYDHSVNSVRTVSRQDGVRAVLIGNDPISNSSSVDVRHLSSALIFQSSARLSGYLHNVSCSTQRHTLSSLKLLVRCENVQEIIIMNILIVQCGNYYYV